MTINLHFFGAAGTVTGSCYMFETASGRFLVDCGMFQGPKTVKELNYRDFPFDPRRIDTVLLTHAHIDHSGLLPKLVRGGFRGRIRATAGTADLCSYMLPDAGHIQESEVEHLNRRNSARGRRTVEPIYTEEDARHTLQFFEPIDYERWAEVVPGVRARWWNAGHLLGSASIELEFEGRDRLRVLCSGDIGPDAKLLQADPESPAGFDWVVCETTYGDTDRPNVSPDERRQRLAQEVREAAAAGGALIVPAFAVERTQELIVDLVHLMNNRAIPQAPIYINSPLAIRATEVFVRHARELEEGIDLPHLMRSPFLHFTETAEQSRSIAEIDGFHIILAASGMCDAGRIRHHLKQWLWNPSATVLLTGFQAVGTLGRFLVDGANRVRIQGEDILVRARIRRIDDYSGHADAPELAAWVAERQPIRRGLFLVHGEPEATTAFARRMARMERAPSIVAPRLDDAFDLTAPSAESGFGAPSRRLTTDALSRPDWHNARARLMIDFDEALEQLSSDAEREQLIRSISRTLAR